MNQTHKNRILLRDLPAILQHTGTDHGFWHSTDPILSPGHALAVLQPPHLWDRNIGSHPNHPTEKRLKNIIYVYIYMYVYIYNIYIYIIDSIIMNIHPSPFFFCGTYSLWAGLGVAHRSNHHPHVFSCAPQILITWTLVSNGFHIHLWCDGNYWADGEI